MPSGFVSASVRSAKTRIWIHPTKVMVSSEFLRNEQGVDEVDGEPEREQSAEPVFELHGFLLEAIARARIRDGEGEERDGDGEQNEVGHGRAPTQRPCHECRG